MFLPSQAQASVLDAPCQITVEFTDYASYQHHQLRQQQYREELERQQLHQEQQQRHQQQEQYHGQLLQQEQQHHYQHSFPQQPPSYPPQFQQLPQQLPADQRLLVYQQQQQRQQPQRQHLPHGQTPSISIDKLGNPAANYGRGEGTPTALIDIANSGNSSDPAALSISSAPSVPSGPAYAQGATFVHHGPSGNNLSAAATTGPPANVTIVKQEEHQRHHMPQELQHFSTAGAPPVPSPSPSPSNNAANAPRAPVTPPAVALASTPSAPLTAATAAVPIIAPAAVAAPTYPASSAGSQRINSAAPTFLPPAPPPPSSANNNAPAAVGTVSVVAASAATSTTGAVPSTLSSSPVARQLHLRRQHHPNHNHLVPHHGHPAAHHHNHHQHLQQQIQRRRLFKAQSLPGHPTAYANNTNNSVPLHPLHPQYTLQQQQQQLGRAGYASHPLAPMAENPQATAGGDQAAIDAEIAAQEAAARDYLPDMTGPGINEIRSTEDIKDQYASADHIFVQKTVNLPRAYPLYRAVRGDGNCGWRAIGFCYFEALIYNENTQLIIDEKKRLLELNDYIRDVGGYDPYVYEDMVEETDILFDAILKALPDTEKAIQVLTDAFNDDGSGNSIIYHLRLLTASYLKGNVGVYEGFIAHDGGVIGYCQEWIERPNCEIDHLRVEVLASILLKPSDIVLEIAYLDRSNGSTVTVYKFPDTNIGRAEDTISMRMSLLFRPGHYDILYRPSLPSKAVAESTLMRYLPAEAAMAALIPAPDPATSIATPGPPVASDPSNQLLAQYLPPDNLAAEIVTQTYPVPPRYYERVLQPGTPSIREDTPDLTPGSSSHSPGTLPVKEEPITPALSSPAPPNTIPHTTALRRGSGAIHADTSSLTTPTAPTAGSANAPDQATAQAPTTTGRSPSDLEIHHVAPISYGSAAQSAGNFVNYQGADFQVLSRLPGMFNRFHTQPTSSPFGISQGSTWNAAPGPSQPGFAKGVSTFPVSPAMTSAPLTSGLPDLSKSVPNVPVMPASPATSAIVPGTPMSAISAGSHMDRLSDTYSEPTFSAAGTPVPLMDAPTPVPSTPMPYGAPVGGDMGGGGGGTAASTGRAGGTGGMFLPEPKSTPVRFTKWHFNRLPHDATDPNSSLFRNSRVSTAHFDNPDFQPQEYDPSGGGGEAPSRNRRKSSVLREDNDKK